MNTYFRYAAMTAALLLSLSLVACEGDTGTLGSPGNDGIGFVPMPPADQTLGNYDSDPANTSDQTLDGQLASGSGVWRINLDHKVQLDRGDGAPPVLIDSVILDTDHNVLWVTIDGVDIALEDAAGGSQESIGCLVGAATPCIKLTDSALNASLAYAGIANIKADFGPALDSDIAIVSGVKTSIADMPVTGTAQYLGSSELTFSYTPAAGGTPITDSHTGSTVTVDVDFDPAVNTVVYSDVLGAGLADSHDLGSATTLDGNSYTGVLTGDIVPANAADALVVSGTVEGSFYGPAADAVGGGSETAGVFSFADTDPTGPGTPPTSATGSGSGAFGATGEFTPPPPPTPVGGE